MAETLVRYQNPIAAPDGTLFTATACGAPMDGGPQWHGWIEFVPVAGGDAVRSTRETTQPNRTDAEYWATGLTHVYLQGALARALKPLAMSAPPPAPPPRFDGPAAKGILDPFSVYEKGESLLRRQLAALSPRHLVNIAVEHELVDESRSTLSRESPASLIERIVGGVKAEYAASGRRYPRG